jgi:hypothetical protein
MLSIVLLLNQRKYRIGIRDGGGLSAASQLNDAITNCHGDRMNSVRGAHLADGGLNVLMNRSLLDLEDFADFPRRLTARYPLQDFDLA